MLIRFDGPIPNPTQTLIAALQRRDGGKRSGITKDEEFYLAIMEPGVSHAWEGQKSTPTSFERREAGDDCIFPA